MLGSLGYDQYRLAAMTDSQSGPHGEAHGSGGASVSQGAPVPVQEWTSSSAVWQRSAYRTCPRGGPAEARSGAACRLESLLAREELCRGSTPAASWGGFGLFSKDSTQMKLAVFNRRLN